MSVRYTDKTPTGVRALAHTYDDDLEQRLTPADVDLVAEIFQTPLTGAYQWDYISANAKLRRLYSLGKKLNWNAEIDIDWSPEFAKTEAPIDEAFNPFVGYEPFESMDEDERMRFAWHNYAWTLAQFLHGEQGALLVASQLVTCGPTYDAKLYAASQTFDEARHVEVFNRYVTDRVGMRYEINPHLKSLLDKVLTDKRWDLKFIGMQIIIEGLALSAFHTLKLVARDPVAQKMIEMVIADESRHVAFGVIFLEEFVKSLSPEEIEERAQFAYEACIVMRERLIATEVFAEFGWDVEAARQKMLESQVMEQFRNLLFTRVIPNLKKIGLLPDSVRPKYDALGILQYEDLGHDGAVDWAQLENPYPSAN